jgi:protease I
MDLSGRQAIILVEKLYEDLELWYPCYRLREAGAEVRLAGPEADETYPSKHGYPARTDVAADDIDVERMDALVIPGGYAPDHMRRHPAMVELVTRAVESDKVVGAICHGGWMLASAEVLTGRTATSFFAIRDDLVHAGCEWVDREVVRDGNLVTSRTPDDLPAFASTLLEAIAAA